MLGSYIIDMEEINSSVFERSIEVMDSVVEYLLDGKDFYGLEYDGTFNQLWVLLLHSLILAQTELPYNTRILVLSNYDIPVNQDLFPFSPVVFENYNYATYDRGDWDRVILLTNDTIPRYQSLTIKYRNPLG